MIKVAYYHPLNHQKWLISLIETFHFDGTIYFLDKFIPRPVASIIFHFNDRPSIFENISIDLDLFFVAPVIPQALFLKFNGYMDTLVVSCNPTILSRIFKLNLSPESKGGINLPKDLFYPLWEEMKALKHDEDRIALFDKFIFTQCGNKDYIPDAIDNLFYKISEKGITTPLHVIMKECNASSRTLQRHFIKRTGVTPKVLMRVIRLNRLWTKITNTEAIDYQDWVFNGNYFDQAHFINDFKDMVGETPRRFFSRDLKVVELFSGKTNETQV